MTTAPRRIALGDPPTVQIGAFRQTCMDCHRMFPPADDPPKQLMQHTHIKLDHGINDRCRNCHDPEDRNRLVLHGGESIPYERVVELCAKCHGPTYHEWQRGAHGRTNGYWNPAFGPVRKLKCTECHDPHSPRHPAMDPVRPLPPPNTLRMGEPRKPSHDPPEERRDPLWPVLDTASGSVGQQTGAREGG
ncbi:MAG: hypothetical protein D6744_13315 [Planctomycetota bacterium]|nr:MAG: hypothetical protein D6744_13315 [Planctomycetota bacterium]